MTLEEKFSTFLKQVDGAECIDESFSDRDLKGKKRADFLLTNRTVILEIKTLVSDTAEKADALLFTHQNRPDFPLFYWESDLDEILPYLADGENIRKEIVHAVTRPVQTALEKADDQIHATKEVLELPDSCGVLVFLNESVTILAPDIVSAKAMQMLRKTRDGSIRYRQLAYVLVISESHTVISESHQNAFPVSIVEGPMSEDFPWALEQLSSLMFSWAAFLGVSCSLIGATRRGELIYRPNVSSNLQNTLPTKDISRHEYWRMAYRKKPYLRAMSENELVEHAVAIVKALTPNFLKGRKATLPNETIAKLFELFTHVLEEAEHRRLDMRKVQRNLPSLSSYGVV